MIANEVLWQSGSDLLLSHFLRIDLLSRAHKFDRTSQVESLTILFQLSASSLVNGMINDEKVDHVLSGAHPVDVGASLLVLSNRLA